MVLLVASSPADGATSDSILAQAQSCIRLPAAQYTQVEKTQENYSVGASFTSLKQ